MARGAEKVNRGRREGKRAKRACLLISSKMKRGKERITMPGLPPWTLGLGLCSLRKTGWKVVQPITAISQEGKQCLGVMLQSKDKIPPLCKEPITRGKVLLYSVEVLCRTTARSNACDIWAPWHLQERARKV